MKDHVHLPRKPFSQLQQALPPTFFRPSSMLASWGEGSRTEFNGRGLLSGVKHGWLENGTSRGHAPMKPSI